MPEPMQTRDGVKYPDAGSVAIYGLRDPRGGSIRYVGKAVNVERRYAAHKSAARHSTQTCHRVRWLRSLYAHDVMPELIILDWVRPGEERIAERYYIRHLRAHGCDLVNTDDGGTGGRHGQPLTLEQRAAISAAHKRNGVSPSPQAHAARRRRLNSLSAEELSAWGKRLAALRDTPEWRMQRSALSKEIAARPGMHDRLVAAACASQATPEQRQDNSERVKALWQDPTYAARICASNRARAQDPNERQRNSARAKAQFADPAVRKQLADRAAALHQDPIYAARAREALARGREARWARYRAERAQESD